MEEKEGNKDSGEMGEGKEDRRDVEERGRE